MWINSPVLMEIVDVARLKEVKFMALLHGLVQNKPGIEVSVFLAHDDQMICFDFAAHSIPD